MGNTIVVNKGEGLATVAVARYLRINKEQIYIMHDVMEDYANAARIIQRESLHLAMSRADIRKNPDRKVLGWLFTMFDITGADCVRYEDFIVGISVLACPGESLSAVLKFAMELIDRRNTGQVQADHLITILKSKFERIAIASPSNSIVSHFRISPDINLVVAYFGDAALTLRQIHKLVDNIYDTITFISFDPKDILTHGECIDRLLQEPLIQRVAFNRLVNVSRVAHPTLRKEIGLVTRLEEESMFSSDVSSVMLSPLAKGKQQSYLGDSALVSL